MLCELKGGGAHAPPLNPPLLTLFFFKEGSQSIHFVFVPKSTPNFFLIQKGCIGRKKRVYIETFRRQFIPRTDKKMVDVLRMNLLFVEFIISLLPA